MTAPGGADAKADFNAKTEEIPWEQRALVGSAEKIQIALDDFDCRTVTNYQSRLFEVLRSLEQEFIISNQSVLNELLQAAELG